MQSVSRLRLNVERSVHIPRLKRCESELRSVRRDAPAVRTLNNATAPATDGFANEMTPMFRSGGR
jgi:hypothetical protein